MSGGDRLSAPRGHLGVLIAPSADEFAAAVLRGQRRRGSRRPIIATGHQAEFFHAGVLAKSIVADRIARAVGGRTLFVAVDSDVPKTDVVRVAVRDERGLRAERIRIPGCDVRLPSESQPPQAASAWRAFFERLHGAAPRAAPLATFAAAFLDAPGETIDVCDGLRRGHAAVAEHELGLAAAGDVRASELSRTREFRGFVADLLSNAERFAACYNDAQADYRRRWRVRNPRRPVPPLAVGPDRVELPLWIERRGEARRRLFARRRGGQIELFAEDERVGGIRLDRPGRNAADDEAWEIERAGWAIRPRALALTAFVRLTLADAFIHGIGGALYDEITDQVIRDYWGVEPPPRACATATLLLPAAGEAGFSREALLAARRDARDARFNPERHAPVADELLARKRSLIAESDRLRREARLARSERRRVFEALRETGARMRAQAAAELEAIDRRVHDLERRAAEHAVAADREYFYALHPRESLRRLVTQVDESMSKAATFAPGAPPAESSSS